MPDEKVYILSTRPLEPSLLVQAASKNIEIDTLSLIRTEPIRNSIIKKRITDTFYQTSAVIFTSMNAAEAVADHLNGAVPKWNIYCLGEATKEIIIQKFPLSQISGEAGNASMLADEIIKDDIHKVIFFCGNQRRNELPDKLGSRNISIEEIIVYNTEATPEKVVKVYNGILFFSPSAVESFFTINTIPEETILFAIGATTSECIRQYSNNRIILSEQPGKKNLAEKAINYFAPSKHTNEHITK